MAKRGSKAGKKQRYEVSTASTFSGNGQNMKAAGKVPCRVINDWTHPPSGNHFYARGERAGEPRRVPVLHGLAWFDHFRPLDVATYGA